MTRGNAVPPEIHFYRSFRAAMTAYLKATRRYSGLMAAYLDRYPADQRMARIDARTDPDIKSAMGDQQFFYQEVVMYGLAYLVQQAARRTWQEENDGA